MSLPISDTALSVAVISEAARGLGIEEGMTPAQEAFSVTVRFQERLLRNVQQRFEKQDENERRKTEQELGQHIASMSDEQREQTRKLLQVEKLTGETMRSALAKASAPAAIIGLVELSGFGAYMALSRVIYAVCTVLFHVTVPFTVYTSASSFLAFITGPVGWMIAFGLGWWQIAKGNQKINREMLAQAVWMGVMNLDEPIVPPDEILPSWVPQGSRQAIEHQDAAFAQLIQERDAAIAAHQESTRTLEQTQRALSAAQAKAQSEAERRAKAEARRCELESRIPALNEQRQAAERRLAEVQREADAYRQRAQELPEELAAQLRLMQLQHAQAMNPHYS